MFDFIYMGGERMSIKTNRTLISTAEAAEILGVTQGRVRQLVLPGPQGQQPVLWFCYLGTKILCLDKSEVTAYGRDMQKRRDAGKVRGQAPGGYKRDRPGHYKRGA